MENSISTNILWRFAERFFAQIISFAVTIVLARLLMPEHYGVVALVNVFILIADVFVESGFSSALIQKKDSDNFDFSTVLYFNIIFSLTIYAVLFFVAPIIAGFYENDLLTPVIRVLSIRVIFAAINSIQQAYISKRMQFKKYFWATFFGTVVSGVVGIVLAYNGFGVWALVFQYLTNIIVDTFVLSIVIKWKPSIYFSFKRLWVLFKYGWKILFEGLCATLSMQLRSLVIGKTYTETELGYYDKGKQFPSLIMNNINTSINSVLFPAISRVQDDDEQVVSIMRKSVRIISYILFPMLFGMAAVATNMVSVLLTDKWIDCVPYIYISCFTFFMTIGMYPRHQALKAKGKSGVFMVEHFIARIIDLILLLLVYKISVFVLALSGIVMYIVLFATVMFTSKVFTKYRYRDQIKDVFGVLMLSLTMFVPVFFFGYLLDLPPIVELIIQLVLGIAIYILLSLIFKPEGFLFVIGFAKKCFKRKENKN